MKNLKSNYRKLIAKFFLLVLLSVGLSTFALANTVIETNNIIIKNFRVNSKKTRVHHYEFNSKVYVYIKVTGNKKTDLDLIVRDSKNNVVRKDLSKDTDGNVEFYVPANEIYKISVVNNGKKTNDYELGILIYDDWRAWL